MRKLLALIIFLAFSLDFSSSAQQFVANYDESKVPAYTLPDPLKFENGKQVRNVKDWEKRRAEIFKIFESEVYGITPSKKTGSRVC